jgi:spore maturation protein CgeB
MKILVVGDGHSAIHEVAVVAAFRKLGHQVEPLYWAPYFNSVSLLRRFWKKAQNKYLFGPSIERLNLQIFETAVDFNPQLIFIYRGTHVKSQTLVQLKRALPKCKIFGYNNDDPFAFGHPPWLWRHFLKCLPVYDLVFAYRHHNLNDFIRHGAKHSELLRSWYIPEINHRVSLSTQDLVNYECDVVFIGHYENDGRLDYLEEIAKAGYNLKIFGPPYEWNKLLLKSKALRHLAPVHSVWNAEYNKAICGAKIALCFFSKLNRDTYTRRCFEIPASGTLLLSEHSDDMATIYSVGEEVDFFKTKQDLVSKVRFYLENDRLRRQVASGGHKRVVSDGHDIVSRMANVVALAEQ